MQFYRLVGKTGDSAAHPDNAAAHTFYPPRSHVAWATSAAQVSSIRQEWVKSGKVAKKADIVTEEVEISTNKQEMLAWLSANATVAAGE
jgi:hypothetical protein